MSGEVFPGDEWKHDAGPTKAGPTRAEEQARINALYATGRMTLAAWRDRSAELSEPLKWDSEGKRPPTTGNSNP